MTDRKTKTALVNGDKACVAMQKARQVLQAENKNRVFAKAVATRYPNTE